MTPNNEMLMAYADGEFNSVTAKRVERAIARCGGGSTRHFRRSLVRRFQTIWLRCSNLTWYHSRRALLPPQRGAAG
jgi:hypothetical protein